MSRHEPGRYDDLISERDVERVVTSGALRFPGFRLVKEGEKIDLSAYTEEIAWRPAPFTGSAVVERVLAEWEAGATLVLQGLHMNWPPLARFCRELEAFLGHPVQANAYYTPRRSQGLSVHHDTHDVFVLQVAGEKRWLVYEPAWELPLKEQRYSRELGEPGEPVEDFTLRAGDALYLPRGWLHEALTSETDSLHVTVGVNTYTWLDAFKQALEECAQDVDFRRAVPLVDAETPPELLDRLAERLGGGDVARRMRERFVGSRRPILDGQLTQLRALDRLTGDTRVERRRTVLFDLVESGGEPVLSFEGKSIAFPAHARDEVEHAALAEGSFRPRDLPGELDEAGRLVLVRRLVREGFLRLSDEPGRDGRARPNDADA